MTYTGTHRDAQIDTEIVALDADGYIAAVPGLAALLIDAVEGGASLNFLAGVTEEEARVWWTDRLPQVIDGTITALVAEAPHGGERDEGARGIVGSTLLVRSRNQNSPHRAGIAKVLVHRTVRRRGFGRALMAAAEALARAEGRWLLMLDTHTGGDADAF
jgi:GNAT superfamily N-acetyltransferase